MTLWLGGATTLQYSKRIENLCTHVTFVQSEYTGFWVARFVSGMACIGFLNAHFAAWDARSAEYPRTAHTTNCTCGETETPCSQCSACRNVNLPLPCSPFLLATTWFPCLRAVPCRYACTPRVGAACPFAKQTASDDGGDRVAATKSGAHSRG